MKPDSCGHQRVEDNSLLYNAVRDRLILLYLNVVAGWCSTINYYLSEDSHCPEGTLGQILGDKDRGLGTFDQILSLMTNNSMGRWLQRKYYIDREKVIGIRIKISF